MPSLDRIITFVFFRLLVSPNWQAALAKTKQSVIAFMPLIECLGEVVLVSYSLSCSSLNMTSEPTNI